MIGQAGQGRLILRQAVSDAGADHLAFLGQAERRVALVAVAQALFQDTGRLGPVLLFPEYIGADIVGVGRGIGPQGLERLVRLVEIVERPRFQHPALGHDVLGQQRGARVPQRLQRLLRIAVHQVDRRQIRGNRRLGDAIETMVDLVV